MLPEGSEAVERQTDSGSATPEVCAAEYQVWNWVKGDVERSERESAPLVYWSARCGPEEVPEGATADGLVRGRRYRILKCDLNGDEIELGGSLGLTYQLLYV